MALSKDDILNASDLETVSVDVPEWGGTVYVGMMTGAERDRFEREWVSAKFQDNPRAKLAALTLCDESGNRLFSYEEAEQLGKKSAAALSRVFDAATKLNRITGDDVDELAGN